MSLHSVAQNTDIFQLVKEINMYEVARRYLPGELRRQGSRWVTRCPFHEDKDPSLVIFPDGWKCFGCGEHGDATTLVARLCNLRPLEAARMIATDFHIPIQGASREEQARARQAYFRLKARRELESRFRQTENNVYQRLAALYRAVDRKLFSIRNEAELEKYGSLYHIEPLLLYVLEVLRTGTTAEKIIILKSEQTRRWCNHE